MLGASSVLWPQHGHRKRVGAVPMVEWTGLRRPPFTSICCGSSFSQDRVLRVHSSSCRTQCVIFIDAGICRIGSAGGINHHAVSSCASPSISLFMLVIVAAATAVTSAEEPRPLKVAIVGLEHGHVEGFLGQLPKHSGRANWWESPMRIRRCGRSTAGNILFARHALLQERSQHDRALPS